MLEFPWEGFLMQLREYVRKEPRIEPYLTRHALPKPTSSSPRPDGYQIDYSDGNTVTDDFTAQISFAAQTALKRVGVNSQGKFRSTYTQDFLLILYQTIKKATTTRDSALLL